MSRLPLVFVVDDELGLPEVLEKLQQADSERWICKLKDRRRRLCELFGLVPSDEPDADRGAAVARVAFTSGLRVVAGEVLVPDVEGVLEEIEGRRSLEGEFPVLLLIDVEFQYGRLDVAEQRLTSVNPRFGLEALLPELARRYGRDASSTTGAWIAYPSVVLSGLDKDEIDETARRLGARGMLPKHGWPREGASARQRLAGYLEAHGLLTDAVGELVGRSIPFLNALAAARRAAKGPTSVLIEGESGTGKELIARYIHRHAGRPRDRYLVFHAAGRGDELQEDELFGHWPGAFTGATGERPGLLEEVNGGSLLIDEIGDVGLRVQNALMRPLQERVTSRIGRAPARASREVPVDIKFLLATNKDLDRLVLEGSFKLDLLQRMRQVIVKLPPLRQRPGDITLLAQTMLKAIDAEVGSVRHELDDGAVAALEEMDFHEGNVRELRNRLLRVVLDHPEEERLTAADFAEPPELGSAAKAEAVDFESARVAEIGRSLARWAAGAPDRLAVAELRRLSGELQGAAPDLIVALLEVASVAARLEGGVSLQRIVGHFWGVDPSNLTPQEARRALLRILKVEFRTGSVVDAAERSEELNASGSVRRQIASARKTR